MLTNKGIFEIAAFYEKAFFDDCKRLNIDRPSIICKATEHIEDMINLIRILESKGFTYVSNGNVYFEINKFKDYSKLANITLDEFDARSRVEVDKNKRNKLDFVLWFTESKYKDQIMQWNSPWGRGFPGWHIECSAMSMKYLGDRIDIHCGGVDHIPIHHTNEIAQSEAAIGHEWVNYWIHGEFLILDGNKMSKSGNDFLTLTRLLQEGFDSLDFRFLCLQSRYRKQLIFSFELLQESRSLLNKLRRKIEQIYLNTKDQTINQYYIDEYIKLFTKYISDDLNLPNAISVLYEVLQDDNLNNNEKVQLILKFDKVFGLDLLCFEKNPLIIDNEETIKALIIERNEAKINCEWEKADQIRNKIKEMGFELIDTKGGTIWKKQKL